MDKKNNNFIKDIIISIIFLTWFIGSIVALLIFSKINGYYTVMIFGQYFLVFGLIPLLNKDSKNLIGIPFALVGLACIIIPYLMMHPETLDIQINWDIVIPLLILSVFIVAGILLIIIPIRKTKKLKEKCSIEVSATIIENEKTYDEGKILYCPIYEFVFNGKKYSVMNNQYSNINIKPVGSIVNLKINPENPEEFLDNRKIYIIPIIIGICSLLSSILAVIIILKNMIS